MSEFQFGVTITKLIKKDAERWERICRQEGGFGLVARVFDRIDRT